MNTSTAPKLDQSGATKMIKGAFVTGVCIAAFLLPIYLVGAMFRRS